MLLRSISPEQCPRLARYGVATTAAPLLTALPAPKKKDSERPGRERELSEPRPEPSQASSSAYRAGRFFALRRGFRYLPQSAAGTTCTFGYVLLL